ncbi:type I-E CRISPR-associated protein Cse2/CasB [Phreatobacter stygius]|uniref:CRISPR-associated protein Cse2 n=1 Tax=Phreatobacter stygius TaxID=1940610 RepID=A0A4D7AZS1_9HYPH|nr:type I-E CRISPR-associated protein Cse2/CasB [Phreatobacter stygius]QCI66839.1 CRISPR-associated protein Cse2 [Phreatobacter stygius]
MRDYQRQSIERHFREWWEGLTDAGNDGRKADRAALARLRRIDLAPFGEKREPDLTLAFSEAAFRNLYRRIRGIGELSEDREPDLATAAVTLAHIRQDAARRKTAAMLGGPDDDARKMKEVRFLRLMRVSTAGDLFNEARRLSALLDRQAPVGELGASLLLWRHVPRVRRDWARAYYGLDVEGLEPTETDIAQAGA